MRAALTPSFFDRARRLAAAGIVLAGLCAITGSLLDWAVITEREVAADVDFGEQTDEIEPGQGEPFKGVDDRDGRLTLAGGVGLIAAAVALVVRKTTGFAWLAFWVSLAIGGIAFADYRTVSDTSPDSAPGGILLRHEVGEEASPGVGLTLVAAAGMLGIISSVGGVAATPRIDEEA